MTRNRLVALVVAVTCTAAAVVAGLTTLPLAGDSPPGSEVDADGVEPSDRHAGGGHDHDHHGEHGDHGLSGPVPPIPLSADEQRELSLVQGEASAAARDLLTVAAAMEAGYVDTHTESPGSIHLVRPDMVDDRFDARRPEMLLASGREDDDPILALVYFVLSDGGPPEAFPGTTDVWHVHPGVCTGVDDVMGLFEDHECDRLGGSVRDGWMLHAWLVPGTENPWGTFAVNHPEWATG